jgi:hypothetical protein
VLDNAVLVGAAARKALEADFDPIGRTHFSIPVGRKHTHILPSISCYLRLTEMREQNHRD